MVTSAFSSPPADPPRRKLTREEVLAMIEAGILREDEHIELIDGELLTMSPRGPTHRMLAVVVHRALDTAYGGRAHVQDRSSIDATAPVASLLPQPGRVAGSPGRRPYGARTQRA